jgi:hypothetical protein
MMELPRFKTQAVNKGGDLEINRAAMIDFVKNQMPEHKGYWLSLIPQGDIRSVEFNAYYWGHVLKTISEECGYTTEELHEEYKKRYNPIEKKRYDFDLKETVVEISGGTTTKLSTKKFAEYIEKIKLHAVEFLGVTFDIFKFWVAAHPDEVEFYAQRMG